MRMTGCVWLGVLADERLMALKCQNAMRKPLIVFGWVCTLLFCLIVFGWGFRLFYKVCPATERPTHEGHGASRR